MQEKPLNIERETKMTGREPFGWNLEFYANAVCFQLDAWDIQEGIFLSPSTPDAMEVL